LRRPILILCILAASFAPGLAQPPSTRPHPVVRYHFGDDPDGRLRWADPNFDDSAWPVAHDGRWPLPPAQSDGFVWVRFRVPVPGDVSGPLAIRQLDPPPWPGAEELYVNGFSIVVDGRFPPHSLVLFSRCTTVFDLPTGVAPGGTSAQPTTAMVALRAWYQPARHARSDTVSAAFSIDQARTLRAEERADRARVRLAYAPQIMLDLLLALVGIGLFFLGRRSERRELFWCAAFLCTYAIPSLLVTLAPLLFLPIPSRWFLAALFCLQALQMWVGVEFIRTLFAQRSRLWRWSAIASLLVFNGSATLILVVFPDASGPLLRVGLIVTYLTVLAFNGLTWAADFWALFVRRSNRPIAATLAVIPTASTLGLFGFSRKITAGPVTIDLFDLGFLLCGFAVAAMLAQRAWKAMRAADELSAEFEAAREVQQQLVIPPVDIPGFQLESAYLPAKQVGGDFFRVRPVAEDGALVVVGDVSGKGLRAAMTVSSIIGALRTMPPASPAEILNALNRGLTGHLGGGFVTCCVARIDRNGQVSIANAGHLPPYCNGAEVHVEAGLPLGILAESAYEQVHLRLAPSDSLTFVTDGVVEARNAAGELFGFERTCAISRQPATQIAGAAQTFGQDDDITVLKLTIASASAGT
jgi:sigma-B regulation protein RsbU (phosphoserine phosphatase)